MNTQMILSRARYAADEVMKMRAQEYMRLSALPRNDLTPRDLKRLRSLYHDYQLAKAYGLLAS